MIHSQYVQYVGQAKLRNTKQRFDPLTPQALLREHLLEAREQQNELNKQAKEDLRWEEFWDIHDGDFDDDDWIDSPSDYRSRPAISRSY